MNRPERPRMSRVARMGRRLTRAPDRFTDAVGGRLVGLGRWVECHAYDLADLVLAGMTGLALVVLVRICT